MSYKEDYILISAADYTSWLRDNFPNMDKDNLKARILSFLEGYLRCDMYFKRIDMLSFDDILMRTFEKCMNYIEKGIK